MTHSSLCLNVVVAEEDAKFAVSESSDGFASIERQNDTAAGGASRVFARISVHEKAGAAEHLVRGIGRESHGERAVLDAVERRTDGVNSLGNGAEVADGLHRRIIFPRTGAGIAERDKSGFGGREFPRGLFEEPHVLESGNRANQQHATDMEEQR